MKILLYNVGRNLNRAYRTCFSFGISEMIMIGKSGDRSIKWELKGNLYAAKEKVKVINTEKIPDLSQTVALENYYAESLYDIDWSKVTSLLIGGETKGLPKKINPLYKATIPTINSFCLTVEASLAIALSEWRRNIGQCV